MIDVVYAEEFVKDLKKLKSTPYYNPIKTLCFDQIPLLRSFAEIPSLNKLKGFDDYYRIRKGDFRIGIQINGSTMVFLRCLSRKDIYKYFPK
jgi:mRNA interferase RelE/StbE